MLQEQLQELQAALLASILDMDEYRRGRRSSSPGPASPLEWSDGLLLLHTCPPPLDRHLLGLLGGPQVCPRRPTIPLLSRFPCAHLASSPSGGEGWKINPVQYFAKVLHHFQKPPSVTFSNSD